MGVVTGISFRWFLKGWLISLGSLFPRCVGTAECCVGAFAEATDMRERAFGKSALSAVETPACVVKKPTGFGRVLTDELLGRARGGLLGSTKGLLLKGGDCHEPEFCVNSVPRKGGRTT